MYDRYDHNPFINRVKDILDLYKFYLDDQYKIYFRAGCQVLEKRFLERLDTALTSDEVPGPSVDLNVKRQGETWKAILEELDAVHSALQTAATNPSKADRNLEPQERLNKALVRPGAPILQIYSALVAPLPLALSLLLTRGFFLVWIPAV